MEFSSVKISICTNHYSPSIGGCETVTRNIAEHLSKDHDVSIITRRYRGRKHSEFSLPIIEYLPGDLKMFVKQLNRLSPDVVFIYSDVFDFFRQLITEPRKQFKLIIALCGANWLHSHRNFTRILYRNLSNINWIVCHSTCGRDYKLCSSENFKKKTVVIPNGVNLEEFDSNNIKKEDLQPDLLEKRWVLNVANFFPGKGQEYMVDILNRLPHPENIAYLQIASDINFKIGEQMEAHWKKIVKTKLNKDIQYLLIKNPKRKDVVGYFKNSNVLVSTSQKEVAPLILLEAMACSIPWISTNIGNAENLKGGKCIPAIKDSQYYSYFDNRVFKLFAKGIEELWAAPIIAEDGRLQVEKEMTWDKILPKYSNII